MFGNNNIGTLTAIANTFLWLLDCEETNEPVAIHCDSKYAAKPATGKFKANTNKYLSAQTKQLFYRVKENREMILEHVKAHSNDLGNDKADELASKGAEWKACNIGRYENTNQAKQQPNKQRLTRIKTLQKNETNIEQ